MQIGAGRRSRRPRRLRLSQLADHRLEPVETPCQVVEASLDPPFLLVFLFAFRGLALRCCSGDEGRGDRRD
jgi:hypothetical protein